MEALQKLEAWFAKCPGALIAFSGGVDSSLTAFVAQHFLGRDSVLAVISASPSLKLSDLAEAKEFARLYHLPLKVITTQEMQNADYFSNPSNRCYYCKHTLYDELAGLRDIYPNWWVLNGTNVDDHGDYRPGLKAAEEFQVHSPLAECGLTKEDVRVLAEHFQLSCWNKPASPCLASRVPYGENITVEKLRQIEAAEALLKVAGFPVNRVRHMGEAARLEVPQEDVKCLQSQAAELVPQVLALGFDRVELDEEGFVSGKLNRALNV